LRLETKKESLAHIYLSVLTAKGSIKLTVTWIMMEVLVQQGMAFNEISRAL